MSCGWDAANLAAEHRRMGTRCCAAYRPDRAGQAFAERVERCRDLSRAGHHREAFVDVIAMLTQRREIHARSCQDAPLPETAHSRCPFRMTTRIHQTCSPLPRFCLRASTSPRPKTCWRRLLQSLRCPIRISTATPRATIRRSASLTASPSKITSPSVIGTNFATHRIQALTCQVSLRCPRTVANDRHRLMLTDQRLANANSGG